MTLAELALGKPAPISMPGLGIQQDIVTTKTHAGRAFNGLVRKMTAILPRDRCAGMGEVGAALLGVMIPAPPR